MFIGDSIIIWGWRRKPASGFDNRFSLSSLTAIATALVTLRDFILRRQVAVRRFMQSLP